MKNAVLLLLLSVSFGFAEAAQNEEILSSSSGAESSSSFYAGQQKTHRGTLF
ncbi:MAG: hypothetical protein WCX75_06615 [Fibrobacteraceae bacterium]